MKNSIKYMGKGLVYKRIKPRGREDWLLETRVKRYTYGRGNNPISNPNPKILFSRNKIVGPFR